VQIFFLRSFQDGSLEHEIHQHLIEHGVSVWLDSHATGDPYEVQLKQWLETSRLIVVLATPSYLKSERFRSEWRVAKQVPTRKLVLALDGSEFKDKSTGVAVIPVNPPRCPSSRN
jgi:hypothetical protein